MKSYKVAVCGHFGLKHNLHNGQTIKTIIITNELECELGNGTIWRIDTHGIWNILMMFPRLIYALKTCQNLIIFPAHNGLKIQVPWISLWNIFFKRKLMYVVIGGWLSDYLDLHKSLLRPLKKFDNIFVETFSMKKDLNKRGFQNIKILPNCKPLRILTEKEICITHTIPLRLATFSRVMKEKGIEEAVEAVKRANKIIGDNIYTLTIYGQIDDAQTKWFDHLQLIMAEDDVCRYGGLVPFKDSINVLKNCFALLFPTYYDGEGFAGTLIDALAAGVPVIASDWKYNSEIIEDFKTGRLVSVKDIDAIASLLVWAYQNQGQWNSMKKNCIIKAHSYLPKNVIPLLVEQIKAN